METLAVDLQLLRSLMVSDLKLSVGRTLMARVATVDANGRGTISLAGTLLAAELPRELQAGQEIRLQVREVTPEKVVLGLQERPPILDQPVNSPLPGGGVLVVSERTATGGGADGTPASQTLEIVYYGPSLGAVEMQFVLDPETLRLTASLSAGEPYELALSAAGDLREALAAAVPRAIAVSVKARQDPLDIYV